MFIQGDKPELLDRIAEVFPIQHLALALQESFDPFTETAPWPLGHWLVIALWGGFGALVAALRFRWTPSR